MKEVELIVEKLWEHSTGKSIENKEISGADIFIRTIWLTNRHTKNMFKTGKIKLPSIMEKVKMNYEESFQVLFPFVRQTKRCLYASLCSHFCCHYLFLV